MRHDLLLEDLISVVTPVYNSEKYISETIISVLNQTYKNWELILVDDCSTDNSSQIISGFSDSRIKYLKLIENSGAAVARNHAIESAQGRYICFLDADDLWMNTKLSDQLIFMKCNDIQFSYTGYRILGNNSTKIVKIPKSLNYERFMKNTAIATSTVMIDRDKIPEIQFVNVRADHDSMTWAKLLRSGITAYGLDTDLMTYRKVSGSISNNKFKAVSNHWKNCRAIEKIGLVKCIYYFAFYGFNAVRKHYF